MKTRALLLVSACLAGIPLPARGADWPQWRGPDRTGVSPETGLLSAWPRKGPKLLWTYRDAGIGFSGPAVVGDRLYTLGARGESEYVFALNVQTGKEVWHTKVGPIYTFPGNTYGDGPRSTPTVEGDAVYALGGMGDLVCVTAATGKERWRKNLLKDLDGDLAATAGSPDRIGWGFSEGLLVDGAQLMCTPGGKQGTVAALDKKTGTVLWRSTKLTDQANYSSLVAAELGGVRQYLVTTSRSNQGRGVASVAAKDGKLLWQHPERSWAGVTAVVPTPIVRDDSVYVSVGYGAGCDLLHVTGAGKARFAVKAEYKGATRKAMKNNVGGVVRVGDHLYGYSDKVGWICQAFRTGKIVWKERRKLIQGSLICADGHLVLFSDEGTAVLIDASPKGWKESGRFDLPEQSRLKQTRKGNRDAKTWTPPVVANGRLYLREQELLFCFDVKK